MTHAVTRQRHTTHKQEIECARVRDEKHFTLTRETLSLLWTCALGLYGGAAALHKVNLR